MTDVFKAPIAKITYISAFDPAYEATILGSGSRFVTTEALCIYYRKGGAHDFVREDNSNWYKCRICKTEECHA